MGAWTAFSQWCFRIIKSCLGYVADEAFRGKVSEFPDNSVVSAETVTQIVKSFPVWIFCLCFKNHISHALCFFPVPPLCSTWWKWFFSPRLPGTLQCSPNVIEPICLSADNILVMNMMWFIASVSSSLKQIMSVHSESPLKNPDWHPQSRPRDDMTV